MTWQSTFLLALYNFFSTQMVSISTGVEITHFVFESSSCSINFVAMGDCLASSWAIYLTKILVSRAQKSDCDCRAPLLIACTLWLNTLFRIKACFRKHAYCLVRKHNAESGQGVKPRRARPEASICCVSSLDKGITIMLRLAPYSYRLQITQRA